MKHFALPIFVICVWALAYAIFVQQWREVAILGFVLFATLIWTGTLKR